MNEFAVHPTTQFTFTQTVHGEGASAPSPNLKF